MQLTPNNLDEINDMIAVSYDKAVVTLINIEFKAEVTPSPEKIEITE